MRIYIVEDDRVIAQALAAELQKWGYEVRLASDFGVIMEEFEDFKPQLVLMDLMLPSYNGYYWCQKIREVSKVPLIFISSRGENMDMVLAMQYGADDYIVKPINIDLTRVKIQALLRRTYDFVSGMESFEFGGALLRLSDAKLEFEGRSVELTRTELLILESLFKAGGAIVSKNKIMDRCWQSDHFIDDNTLAVNMTRLRKKLLSLGLEDLIKTKRGSGYFLSVIQDE